MRPRQVVCFEGEVTNGVVTLGVERLFQTEQDLLAGQSVGLVTNYTMTDSTLTPVIDLFLSSTTCLLTKLYGPEHGVRNAAKEGELVASTIDAHSALPAYSLYGEAKKPTAEMLHGIDALFIDLQDLGTRYYTNISTVALCMEACAEVALPCIVLDRPNPIGARREGYVIEERYHSFVGMHAIPNRHGLTIGEVARLYNRCCETPCDLTVVPLSGWTRSMLQSETGLPFIAPSPNASSLDMALLYTGTCLFEGTNVSVARGTTRPFEMIGAPWINGHALATQFNAHKLSGVRARPVYFSPHVSLYAGELCEGVQLHVDDASVFHSLQAGITLLQEIAIGYAAHFRFLMGSGTRPFFDLLAGDDRLRGAIQDETALQFLNKESVEHERFGRDIADILLYD